jgi:hypothetical protein
VKIKLNKKKSKMYIFLIFFLCNNTPTKPWDYSLSDSAYSLSTFLINPENTFSGLGKFLNEKHPNMSAEGHLQHIFKICIIHYKKMLLKGLIIA